MSYNSRVLHSHHESFSDVFITHYIYSSFFSLSFFLYFLALDEEVLSFAASFHCINRYLIFSVSFFNGNVDINPSFSCVTFSLIFHFPHPVFSPPYSRSFVGLSFVSLYFFFVALTTSFLHLSDILYAVNCI